MYELKKEVLGRLINKLLSTYAVVSPVKTDETKFARISKPSDIFLKELPLHPAKKVFFAKDEVLFKFKGTNVKEKKPETKKLILFGLRECDLNAIKHQDTAFEHNYEDKYYLERRKNSLLIGYHCSQGDEYCFCNSMNLEKFYDLMFFDKGNKFLVEDNSEKGRNFISKYKNFFKKSKGQITDEDRKILSQKRLDKKDLTDFYNHPDWENGSKLCLSCSACNILCPACYCFNIYDELNFDVKSGNRKRNWASCQLKDFTRVAGNFIFREERNERFKHRIYHQLQWFRDQHNIDLCVGCGRCIRGCPKRIDFIDLINELK